MGEDFVLRNKEVSRWRLLISPSSRRQEARLSQDGVCSGFEVSGGGSWRRSCRKQELRCVQGLRNPRGPFQVGHRNSEWSHWPPGDFPSQAYLLRYRWVTQGWSAEPLGHEGQGSSGYCQDVTEPMAHGT